MSGVEQPIRFDVLGTLRVHTEAREVAIRAVRERTVLAMLLLHLGESVTVQRLVDAVWDENPPRNARNQLHGCVSRLRKQLAAGIDSQIIVTAPDGYRIDVDVPAVDVSRFRQLRGEARIAVTKGDYRGAGDKYLSALRLWRGAVLSDVESQAVQRIATSLEEERAQALEERIEIDLALGGAGDLVAELTTLTAQFPYRERVHRALMLALYRAGRQADALAAYRHARELLREELGIEPGSGLQRLHQAILNRDPALDAAAVAAAPVVVPRQLPSDVAGFTGRTDALKALDELLGGRSEPAGPVVISAIAGTAGVGKTALAVHWGHRVAGRFPDGQLYVNLRGFDPGGAPMEPATAVRGLLDGLQVPPERVPASVDAQVSLYRSLLAERRMLVVLDNARDAEQVRPLLPGSPACLVLVTSRRRLSGLVASDGAVPLPIDVLPAGEARALLAARLGEQRLAAEPDAAAGLVSACAGLPLALAIVAARAATRPGFPLSVIGEEVRAAGAGLEPWAGPDAVTDLRAVFSWSYDALDPAAARLFRLLGLHPGPDLAVPAAASLLGSPVAEARRLLAALTDARPWWRTPECLHG
jgi:DNA-binding SARP family transcriptional activator